MAHNRILEGRYACEGISLVKKSSQYGVFSTVARLNPEDKDVMSEWDGCRIAEYRCDIKIQKEKAKDFRYRLKGMKHLQNILHDKFNDDKNYFTIGMVEVLDEIDNQVRIAERDAKIESEKYHNMKKNFPDYVEQVQKIRREVREKAEKIKE